MNHQTRCFLLRDWMLYWITEDWTTNIDEKSIGPDNQHYHAPYLYHSSSNNQQSSPWFNNIFELQVTQFISNNLC